MKRYLLSSGFRALLTMWIGCQSLLLHAAYTPVTLTGFNADVIANGIGNPTTSTNFAFDGTAFVLIANNYQLTSTSALPTWSLPASGTINSLQTTGVSYQLASYTGNNSLRLQTNNSSGTLTFGTSGLIGDIYVLGASGDGSTTANITVNFTDNTTQVFTGISFPDWFNNTPFAVQGIGRAGRTNGVIDAGAGASNPRFYERKLTLSIANYAKQIASITVTKSGAAGVLNIMAVNVDHQSCLPVQGMTHNGTPTTTTADLSWNAVAGSQGYEYVLQTSATPPTSGTPFSGTTYNATGLQVGTTYYFFVRNKCSASSFSVWNMLQFSTLACPSAGAPTISNNVPGSVTVSWPGSTVTGVTGYQYHVTTSAVAPTSGWSTTTNTSETVTTLIPGGTYYAWVRTNCGSALAPWMNSGSFVNPFPPCYTPGNITISNLNMHGAEFKWNKSVTVPAAQGYQYIVTTVAVPPSSGTPTPDTFHTATNLTEGTMYRLYVRTHCATTNFSDWDSLVFTTPTTCLAPLTPNITNITHNSADISWNNYPGINSYEYFINNSPVAPTFAGIPANYHAVSPLNLNSGTTYFFHLRTRCDTSNYSGWTTTPFTTLINCTSPGTPSITSLGSDNVTIGWNMVPGAGSYEIVLDTVNNQPAFGTQTTLTTYMNNALSPEKYYCFFVRAICSAADVSQWESVCFNTYPLSVNHLQTDGSILEIYPNPATDKLHVRLKKRDGEGHIAITDLAGKTVLRVTTRENETEIDVSSLGPGLYLLRFQDRNQREVLKVQKN